jgi:hypothetical protein
MGRVSDHGEETGFSPRAEAKALREIGSASHQQATQVYSAEQSSKKRQVNPTITNQVPD